MAWPTDRKELHPVYSCGTQGGTDSEAILQNSNHLIVVRLNMISVSDLHDDRYCIPVC